MNFYLIVTMLSSSDGEEERKEDDGELSIGTMNVLLCPEALCKWQNVRDRDYSQTQNSISRAHHYKSKRMHPPYRR